MNEFIKGEDWRLLVVSFGAFVLLLGGQKVMVGFYFWAREFSSRTSSAVRVFLFEGGRARADRFLTEQAR